MSSIHPAPKLAYVRPDGEGGIELVFSMDDGKFIVKPLDRIEAYRMGVLLLNFAMRGEAP